MKKLSLFVSLFATLALMSGCNKKSYNVKKMTVSHEQSYQLWDNFDYSNLKVTYNGTELETYQYTVDFSNFDTGRVGTSEITVTLNKSKKCQITIPVEVTHRTSCNFLAIGNSFSEDLIAYANEIIKNSDANLNINVYGVGIGGCTLDQHYTYFAHENKLYTLLKYNFETKAWEYINSLSLKEALVYESWDVMTLQQHSSYAGQASSFNNLSLLVKSMTSYLKQQNRKIPALGWHMTWAYQNNASVDNMYYEFYNNDQITMYNAIVKQVQDIVIPSGLFNFVLESGTAIQNVRTTSITTEKELTRDGQHLDLTYGRYVATLNLASKLTGYSADHFTYRGETGLEIVSESERSLIFRAVDAAISNPYQITTIED